ncbi:MAG: FtsQ-type POTRA domain-containing protein [Eubacterium sp.]|jgi:cell division protein FtsQ|nr:FtsQ-type POTRA domain-containing protein [Eubacterium sp.]MCH4047530.1 FtsQ-type POTRA domain-containing protein [Eubacterium sp.]MCH4078300.1 FtsQ-type POTRA domain-containing protein [Eubacterium sp.]MCH4109447.1 FtsQ-type POTRA domain-containing protein [Eubacterium sp.]MCI1307601.1 FtsQ-type POTRA domain-containing protein [Eubacterium sp.]
MDDREQKNNADSQTQRYTTSRNSVHVDFDWGTGEKKKDSPSPDEALNFFKNRNTAAEQDGLPESSGQSGSPSVYTRNGKGGSSELKAENPEDLGFHSVPRKKKKHRKKHILLDILIVIALALGCVVFLLSPVFNVKSIEVQGNHYYSDSEVINIADAQKGVSLFALKRYSQMKGRLLENPYFTDVKFRAHLPSTLIIRVKERKQVAAIKYGDQYIVIDGKGRVLRITSVNPEITILKGLKLSRITLGKRVRAEQSGTLQYMLDMIAETQKGDFYFREIDMSGVIVKAYITRTLLVKCSASQLKKAVADGNLQKVVNKLFKSKIYRGTISIGKANYMYFSPSVS